MYITNIARWAAGLDLPISPMDLPAAAARLIYAATLSGEFGSGPSVQELILDAEDDASFTRTDIEAICYASFKRSGFADCVDALVYQASAHFNEAFPSHAAGMCCAHAAAELSAVVRDTSLDATAIARRIRGRIAAIEVATRTYARLTQGGLAFDLLSGEVAVSNRALVTLEAMVALSLQHMPDQLRADQLQAEVRKAVAYVYFTATEVQRKAPNLRALQLMVAPVESMRQSSSVDAVLSEALFEHRQDGGRPDRDLGIVESLRGYLSAVNGIHIDNAPRLLQ